MEIDLENLQTFANQIPETEIANPTFLEISKFPHYENVWSNILKFYFEDRPIHGLGNHLIRSLLVCLGHTDPDIQFRVIEVKREVVTEKGGRIDLVVLSDKFVIIIENKVYSGLHNDLVDYAKYASGFVGKQLFKVVLSISDERENLSGGFKNVTYKAFIDQINFSLNQGNQNSYHVLFDQFIKTIRNRYNPSNMKQNEVKFMVDNIQKIWHLEELQRRMTRHIEEKAGRILEVIKSNDSIRKDFYREPFIYDRCDIVFIYHPESVTYKLECYFAIEEILITISLESNNNVDEAEIRKLALGEDIDLNNRNDDGSRIVIERFNFMVEEDEVIAALNNILLKFRLK